MRVGRRVVWALAALSSVIQKRGEAAVGSGARVNLLFDGDSISRGLGSSPDRGLDIQVAAAIGAEVRLNNVAQGGRPVHECLRLYPQLVAPLFDRSTTRNVIVFHAGDNDIAGGRDASQTYVAFAAYVAGAHRQGWKVVVSTELYRGDFSVSGQAALAEYNRMLRQNRAGADAVVDFDTDRRMTDIALRHDPALFTSDGVHPSDGGYTVLAGMLAPAVKRVMGG